MLQSMRENSQGIIAKIIVGFIIVTFALWGVDSLVGLASAPDAPVKVNGVEISEQQILEGIELQRRQILAQMGENADPSLLEDDLLRGMVVQGLIEQSLLLQRGAEQGMSVSDSHLDHIIRSTGDFQVDGQFDPDRFGAMLRNVGLTPLMYRDYLRKETLISQDRNGIVATAFTLPGEADKVAGLDRQTRDIGYLTLETGALLATQQVDDAEVEQYYRVHQDDFLSEEQVSIAYIELNKSLLAQEIEVDESELQSQYERMIAEFQSEEARDASHILIQVNDTRDEAQAQALADELSEKLKGGADFAELAAQYSEDPGSAADGGALGYVEKGVMVPEFEEALFGLQAGEVSAPVQTDFGYHLIKLNAIERSSAPSLEEARPALVEEQRQQKAESLFVARAEELADISFSSADLREPSEVLGLEIQETGLFGRNGGDAELTAHPAVLRAAFNPELIESAINSEVIELDSDRMLVLRVREHRPAKPQSLDEVREAIVQTLKAEKAQQEALGKARELLEVARQQGLDAVEAQGYTWTRRTAVGRGDTSLDGEVRNKAFGLPKPEGEKPSVDLLELAEGGVALVAVSAVNSADLSSLDENQRQGLAAFLANRHGMVDYQQMLQSLKAKAEVERL